MRRPTRPLIVWCSPLPKLDTGVGHTGEVHCTVHRSKDWDHYKLPTDPDPAKGAAKVRFVLGALGRRPSPFTQK